MTMNNQIIGSYLKCLCFSFLIATVVLSPLAAETPGGFATVDNRILHMLHPLMVDFDYASGRFFRDAGSKKDVNLVFDQLKEARIKAAEQIKPLENKIRELEQSKFKLMTEHNRAVRGLAPGDLERLEKTKAELSAALNEINRQKAPDKAREELLSARRKDLETRLARIEATLKGNVVSEDNEELQKKFETRIASLNGEIKNLREEIAKIRDESVSAIYLTRDETSERIDKVRDEIEKLIKEAAKESKIDIVIDNSFAMRSQIRKDSHKMIPAVQDAPDIVAASLFHSFLNLEFEPGLIEALRETDDSATLDQHLEVGRSIGMRSNLIQYLEYRNYAPQLAQNFSHGRLFITGGTDLTPWVARKLFDRYNVPDSIKNSYMLLLRNYLDFDTDPSAREREY